MCLRPRRRTELPIKAENNYSLSREINYANLARGIIDRVFAVKDNEELVMSQDLMTHCPRDSRDVTYRDHAR